MDTEQTRLALLWSALGGAVVYGTFHLATNLWAGQPVGRADVLRALANVAAAIVVGALTAYFLGPALTEFVPIVSLRDPHVVGFCIGGGSFEVGPFVFGWLRGKAKRVAREKR